MQRSKQTKSFLLVVLVLVLSFPGLSLAQGSSNFWVKQEGGISIAGPKDGQVVTAQYNLVREPTDLGGYYGWTDVSTGEIVVYTADRPASYAGAIAGEINRQLLGNEDDPRQQLVAAFTSEQELADYMANQDSVDSGEGVQFERDEIRAVVIYDDQRVDLEYLRDFAVDGMLKPEIYEQYRDDMHVVTYRKKIGKTYELVDADDHPARVPREARAVQFHRKTGTQIVEGPVFGGTFLGMKGWEDFWQVEAFSIDLLTEEQRTYVDKGWFGRTVQKVNEFKQEKLGEGGILGF